MQMIYLCYFFKEKVKEGINWKDLKFLSLPARIWAEKGGGGGTKELKEAIIAK